MDFDGAMDFFRQVQAAAMLTGCHVDNVAASPCGMRAMLVDHTSDRYRVVNIGLDRGIMTAEVWRNGAYAPLVRVDSIHTAIGVMRCEAPDVCPTPRDRCAVPWNAELGAYTAGVVVDEVQP